VTVWFLSFAGLYGLAHAADRAPLWLGRAPRPRPADPKRRGHALALLRLARRVEEGWESVHPQTLGCAAWGDLAAERAALAAFEERVGPFVASLRDLAAVVDPGALLEADAGTF
jgi:hypothetical protein